MEKETIAALCGALVGGGLTIIANQLQEWIKTAARAEQLAHAIAGEVIAIQHVVSERGYLKGVEARAIRASLGEWVPMRVTARRDYFSTIEANLDSVGLLPAELPILVPRFLILGKAILEDFDSIGQLREQDCSPTELAQRYSELLGLLRQTEKTGNRIVSLVAAIYGSPHGRLPLGLKIRLLLRSRQDSGSSGDAT